MSNSTADTMCPVCGSPVDSDDASCPKCGLKLVDRTQSFTPVAVDTPSSEAQEGVADDLALVVTKGPYAGQVFYLDRPKLVVGRDPGCDIFLNDMTVSRHHAQITSDDTGVTIEDQGSLNGTWINGEITQKAPLALGTTVQIGTFNMVVERGSGA